LRNRESQKIPGRRKMLQRKNYFIQRKKVDAEVEKSKKEAELIEEQKNGDAR
jgi:hypothetical protein